MYGVVAGITAFGGVSALAGAAAHADSTFTFTRIGGADRYATAGLFTAGAFPGGASTIYLADGLPGHQSDALAASGWGGVNNYGALLTDNTNSVPANTTSALSSNKVKNVVILGGINAVSQAQQTALSGAGYTVTRIAGATRLDTMQALDDAIPPASVGKDSSGNPTAILASGDDNHLVDALSAGGTAYGMKFPVILTSSSSSTLAAQAQQVITALGIKHLVVVGGTAAVPASQYSPAPTGVTKVDVEGGADRSATSMVFSDFAISQTPPWDKNSKMELARGDDGADALASAPYSGITDALSTCVTLTPSNPGSCPAFAQEHAATLKGTSVIAGLQAAVTDAAAQAVAQGGGGSVSPGQVALVQSSASPGGTVNGTVTSPGSVQSLTVSGCGFSSQSVTFDPSSGNFTLTIPSSQPSGSCNLTFTATKTAAAGGGTQSTTVPFTVGSGTAAAGCSQTVRAQLCSASIVSTTTAAQSSSSNPAGTIIAYTFNQSVSTATLNAAGFHAETFDGTTRYTGNIICGVTGSCPLPTSPNTVNVLFNAVPLQSTTAAEGAQTLTLATVDRNTPAVTTAGGANTDGSAPIGTAATNTVTAGTTAAPDLESIGTPRAAATANFSAIDLTFDQAAFATGGGVNVLGNFDIVYAAGSTSGSQGLAGTGTGPAADQEAQCTGPGAANTVSGTSLTTPGGNGTTTLTVVCPDTTASPSTTLTSAQIARMIVQPGAVTSAAAGGTANGAVEASDTPHTSAAPTPSLSSVSLQPGTGTALDVVVWTFDTAITPNNTTLLGFYNANASATPAPVAACAPTNNPQAAAGTCQTNGASPTAIAISFAHGALAQAVGGYAQLGAVVNANNGLANGDDELGATNPSSTAVTPGTINAPQLSSVKVAAVNGVFGSTTTGTYTFTQPLGNNGAAPPGGAGAFLLYDQDGTVLTAGACTVGTGTANNTVTCSGYTQTGGSAATAAQLSGAALGTVDAAAVNGSTAQGASSNNPNPEGAVSASH